MITVIIPIYNKEKYLERTLISLLAQTNKNFKVLIIDDGSSDGSLNIVEDFAHNTPEMDIKILVNEINSGVSYSRNKGIKFAETDYITFLDADDVLSNDAIEIYYKYINKNNNIDFFVSNFMIQESNAQIRKNKSFSDYEDMLSAYLKRKVIFHTNGWCIRKKYLLDKNIKFDETLSWGEDILFFSEVILHKGSYVLIDEYLSKHHADVENSLSQNSLLKIKDDIYWLEKLKNIVQEEVKKPQKHLSIIEGYRMPGVIIYRLLYNLENNYEDTLGYYLEYRDYLNNIPMVNGLRSFKLKIKNLELKYKIKNRIKK